MTCCKANQYKWCTHLQALCTDSVGNKYCVFHAPEKNKQLSIDQFNRQVAARITDAYAQNKDCNLSGTIFPGHINFSNLLNSGGQLYNKKLLFESCRFIGGVSCPCTIDWVVLDFSAATFCDDADFSNANLWAAIFTDSKFKKAAHFKKTLFKGDGIFCNVEFFNGACFESAGTASDMDIDFTGARFLGPTSFVKFSPSAHVDFVGATFVNHTNFKECDFSGGSKSFSKAVLHYANFSDCNLSYSRFEGTDLSYCELSNADLQKAELSGAILDGANLKGARLMEADLTGASLLGADLNSANLAEADLSFADLKNASIDGAQFRQADLTRADLRGAKGCALNWERAVVKGMVLDRNVLRTMPKDIYKPLIHTIVLEGLPQISMD